MVNSNCLFHISGKNGNVLGRNHAGIPQEDETRSEKYVFKVAYL